MNLGLEIEDHIFQYFQTLRYSSSMHKHIHTKSYEVQHLFLSNQMGSDGSN